MSISQSHPIFPPLSKASRQICDGIRQAVSGTTLRSESSTGVSSASDNSPTMSPEGTSSETFSVLDPFQQWVDATDRRVQKQRRPFQYASRQELHNRAEELIGQQQKEVFKAHAAVRKLQAASKEQAGDDRKATERQIRDADAKRSRCDAHFTRLQWRKSRGLSPGRCLPFA
eukprot:CAMPEP_0178409304 /NCGR_PEP_ID=MMETSP0689_2-20121128/20394_1 /TAXON_ID=160604 /ORGANISM="Amphidinium massartii, Strain CS-259" /LENGTH=171 /DNA_ID=CAMNT_0020030443 /DNA_START=65 /DNA_END=581 /DNA_ORIENTATION=-